MEKRRFFVVLFIDRCLGSESDDTMFQNGFLVREIENFSKFVIRLFRKEKFADETENEQGKLIEVEYLFFRLQEMIYDNKINEAENILFDRINENPKLEYLKLAEKFYSEVFEMSDEYLLDQNYSRTEIFESLDQIQEIYEKKYNNFYNEDR